MYYLSEINIRGNHAGTKARNDVETILREYGAKALNTKQLVLKSDEKENIKSNIKNRFDYISYFLSALNLKNETVVLQYPMLTFDKSVEFVKLLRKRNKVVFLVHDIHALRRGNIEQAKEEIKLLNLADSVILHNRFMEEKLIELGLNVNNIYKLNIFDYLHNEDCSKNQRTKDVVFAGNLGKSEFLDEFIKSNQDISIGLYGIGFKEEWKQYPNVEYVGNFKPEELPSKLDGKYGLIWDGDKIDTCSGFLGEYTRINNPHKLSLYLASDIPVIVWKEAAIAEYVKENNVGIFVETLGQFRNKLNAISKCEYEEFIRNSEFIKNNLISGNSLISILDKM